MSQLVDSNEVYTAIDKDENGIHKEFGVFQIKTLNDLQMKHSPLPGITDPQLPSTAIPGYSKVVGDIKTFGSRLTQSEDQIDLLVVDVDVAEAQINVQASQISALVTDVSGNQSSITQNANAIASLVTDVAGNTSSISQNSTTIASAVSDINSNYSLIQQNVSNINLKVSKDNIISQINVSPEGIYIEGDNIQLNGNTQVLGSFSVTDISDAGNLATQDNVGSNDVTFNYASSNSKGGRYNAWLTSNELSSGSNPYNGVVMDSGGIRGYGANQKNFELDASNGDVYLRGEIDASGGSIYGDFYVTASGKIVVGFGGSFLEIQPSASAPGLYFTDAYTSAGAIIGNSSIPVNVGSFSTTLNGIEITKSLVVDVDIFIEDDLLVKDDAYIGGDLILEGNFVKDLDMTGSADINLTTTSNRIYGSDGTSYIYFNGSVWRIRDTNGTRDL